MGAGAPTPRPAPGREAYRGPRKDLAEVGLPSAVQAPRCSADVEAHQGGKARVELEIEENVALREIMARVGKAVPDAALRANDGSAPAAAEELGMAKSTWYRVRRR